MLKHLAIIFILFSCFSLAAMAEITPISVKREITSTVKGGEILQLKLILKFVGTKPSGIIITEFLPEGWEITSSLPGVTKFSDHSSWLLYGDDVKDSEIVYELQAPASFKEPALLSGTWETVTANGIIEGDAIIGITQETKPQTSQTSSAQTQTQPETQDNTILYAGIGIVVILIIAFLAVFLLKGKSKPPKRQ